MEASFLFALSALKEWRIDDFDVKQSNIQRHTNPSMVLFCVCIFFIRTNIDIQELTSRLQRTFFCILVITAVFLVPFIKMKLNFSLARSMQCYFLAQLCVGMKCALFHTNIS